MPEADIDLARRLHMAGDLPAAVEAYAAVVQNDPTSFAGLTGLMLIAESMGDRNAARTFFGLLSQYPIRRETLEWTVSYFDHTGQIDRAEASRLSLGGRTAISPATEGPARASGNRLLIVCPNFIGGPQDAAMVRLWQETVHTFNPEADWLMVFDGPIAAWWGACGFDDGVSCVPLAGDGSLELRSRRTVAWYADNIGHLHSTGRDGWGRSLTTGLRAALSAGYDWVAHVEADMLTRVDLSAMTKYIVENEGNWGSPRCAPWGFIESGFFVVSRSCLVERNFLRRYDWPTTPFLPHQEWLFEAMLGPCIALPLKGGRIADLGKDDLENYAYVTKCRDVAHFRRYLDSWSSSEAKRISA